MLVFFIAHIPNISTYHSNFTNMLLKQAPNFKYLEKYLT